MTLRAFALFLPLAALLPAGQEEQIDRIMSRHVQPDGPGAAVSVIQSGKVVFEKGYGMANLEYDAPVSPRTVFHVASVSKQFTAMALVLLEQDKKLALDDDIRKYLPELPGYGHAITIRNLLQHTSGVRDQWDTLVMAGWRMDDVITQDQILRMLFRQKELNFPPGTRHVYSNGGYTLAAEIVARVSQQPFPEFCAKRIFQPLGMTRTHFHMDLRQIVPGRAYSYARDGKGYRAAPLNYANAGATSLFTTASDLVRWLDNFRTAKVGGRAGVERLQERGVLADGSKIEYALGISTRNVRGLKAISHAGGDAGFRSYVVWFPELELGVAVASNLGSVLPDRIGSEVAAVFAGSKMAAEAPAPPPPVVAAPLRTTPAAVATGPAAIADYVGVYWSDELETQYTVRQKDNGLMAVHVRHGEFPLQPISTDRFRAPEGAEARFTRDSSGRVNGLTLGTGRVKGIHFVRK